MARKKTVLHDICNDLGKEYNHFRLYSQISLLAKNCFRWHNLPNNIESRHIERWLFDEGQCAFFEHPDNGFMCLPCASDGKLNAYGDPIKYNITSLSTFTYQCNINDMVLIRENDICEPSYLIARYYADYLNEIEIAQKINLRQQKYPVIFPTTKDGEMTMKNIQKKFYDGELAIMVDKRLSESSLDGVKALQTGIPFLLDKFQEHKNDTLNELFSWLGLNNTNTDKKERLVKDEINVNNLYIMMNLETRYKNRKKACDLINKKYGLDIRVEKVINELQVDFHGYVADPQDNKNQEGTNPIGD